MWIITNRGLLSVTENTTNPEADELVVEARQRDLIEEFFDGSWHTREIPIFEDGETDFPFRAVLNRGQFLLAMNGVGKSIQYADFEKSIKDPVYKALVEKVGKMLAVTHGGSGRGGKTKTALASAVESVERLERRHEDDLEPEERAPKSPGSVLFQGTLGEPK